MFRVLSAFNSPNTGFKHRKRRRAAIHLLRLIVQDHELFLSPLLLAVDRLLAEAISLYWKYDEKNKNSFTEQTDADMIAALKASQNSKVRDIINTILYQPEQINVHQNSTGKGISFGIRKVYHKSPIVNGTLLSETAKGKEILNRLERLKKEYKVEYSFVIKV